MTWDVETTWDVGETTRLGCEMEGYDWTTISIQDVPTPSLGLHFCCLIHARTLRARTSRRAPKNEGVVTPVKRKREAAQMDQITPVTSVKKYTALMSASVARLADGEAVDVPSSIQRHADARAG